MSQFDNKYYKTSDKIEKLIIFIHGYNGSPEAIDYAIQYLRGQLSNAVIVVPRAPNICEKDAQNLQWLSFYKVDPKARFRAVDASVEEIFGIFDALAADFAEVATQMNLFVDQMQQQFAIDDAHTYIAGFSQGAMLALCTALTRQKQIAGCIMLAGIVPARSWLELNIISRPPILVLHGRDDATVQFKTLPTTLKWLEQNNLKYQCETYDNLMHKMNISELQKLADFVNCN